MTISYVAKGSNRTVNDTTVTLAPGALQAGDLIIVSAYSDQAGTVSVADDLGSSYTKIADWVSATNARIWYGYVPAGGGSPTITVTSSISGSTSMSVTVFRGTATSDPIYNYAQFQDANYVSGPWSCSTAGPIATADAVMACSFQPYGVMTVGGSAPNSDFTAATYAGGFCITGHEDNVSWNNTTATASFGNDGSMGTLSGAGLAVFGIHSADYVPSSDITHVGTGTISALNTAGGTLTPALPSGLAQNDLMLCSVAGRPSGSAGTNDGITMPEGWTLLGSRQRWEGGTYDTILAVYYKFAGSSETVPSITYGSALGNGGTTAGISAVITAFRNVNDSVPFDGVTPVGGTNAAATTWAPTGVTTTTDKDVVVAMVSTGDDNTLGLSTGNEQGFTLAYGGASYQTTAGSDHSQAGSYKLVSSHGAVTISTFNQGANGADGWCGLVFALKPSGLTTALTPAVMTLTPQALSRGTDDVARTFSEVIFTLSGVALVAAGTGNISRYIDNPATITLIPQSIVALVGQKTDLTPVVMTLSAQSLTRGVDDSPRTVGIVTITLTTQALSASVGTAPTTLVPVTMSLNAFVISAYTPQPNTGSLAPVIINLSLVALTRGSDTIGISISPAIFTIVGVALTRGTDTVAVSVSSVSITLTARPLVRGSDDTSLSVGIVSYSLTPLVRVYSVGTSQTILTPVQLILTPVEITTTLSYVFVNVGIVSLVLSSVSLNQSIGTTVATLDVVSLMLLPMALLGTYSFSGKIRVWDGNKWSVEPVNVWMGTEWVEKPMKVWMGDQWQLI